MRRTEEEIKAEITTLRAMQPNVRHHGMAGDNRAAIGAQIEVLEERMTESTIYNRFGDEDYYDFDQYLLDEALAAHHWVKRKRT